MGNSTTLKRFFPLIGWLLLGLGFFAAARVHFLLFHTLIELSCVASTWALFSLVWSSRNFSEAPYFLAMATAAVFWGALDVIHALIYQGAAIFPYGDKNSAAQIWIAARLIQSISLFLAPHLMKHKFNPRYLLIGYAGATALLSGMVVMQWFPVCYVEGLGPTPFKRAAEFGAMLVLVGAMVGLWRQQRRFELQGALFLLVASEFCFAVYVDDYDAFSIAGHLLRFGSVYFFYYVFVKMSLRQPYAMLFRELKIANEQLRESEARYRLLADHVVDVIWTMDLAGHFTYMSPSIERLRGYTAEAAMAISLEQGLTPSSLIAAMEAFTRLRAAIVQGELYTTLERLELEQYCRDGSTIWTESYVKAMYTENGDFISILGVTRNIAQRKQAELALRASEERLRLILEVAPIPLVISNPTTGQILDVNQAACELVGYDRETLLGKPVVDFYADSAKERPQLLAELREYGRVSQRELQLRRADGVALDASVSAETFTHAGLAATIIAIHDITERKRAAAALARRDMILEAVSFAAAQFLLPGDWESNVQQVLARLGETMAVSHVYVFENHMVDEMTQSHLLYQWNMPGIAETVEPLIISWDASRPAPDAETMAHGKLLLAQGKALSRLVRAMPLPERAVLEGVAVRSILLVPIFVKQAWWGMIGFYDCVQERVWSALEMETLQTAASILGAAIQRQQVEKALRESEERFRALAENFPDTIIRFDRDLRHLYINSVITQQLGLLPSELIGKTQSEMGFPEPLVQMWQQALRQVFATGESQRMEYELPGQLWFDWVLFPEFAPDGTVSSVISSARDISVRKRAEAELRRREMNLAAVVSIQQQLLWLDVATEDYAEILALLGMLVGVSRAYIFENHCDAAGDLCASLMAEWYEEGREPQIANLRLRNVVYAQVLPRWAEVLGQGGSLTGPVEEFPEDEQHILRHYGIVSILVLPLNVANQFAGFIGFADCVAPRRWVAADVALLQSVAAAISLAKETQQAKAALRAYAQELESSNAELDAFAHMVAHDLKNPLTALIGFAGVLEKRADVWAPERVRESARSILMTAHKMTSIVEELLLLAGVRRMEDVPRHLLDMAGMIQSVRVRLALLIEEYQPEICAPESWPLTLGYGPWVEEVWANYISNAIQYGGTPPRVELGIFSALFPRHCARHPSARGIGMGHGRRQKDEG